jgi:hypothetical protein
MLFVIELQIWSGLKTYGGANLDQLWGADFNAPGNRIVVNLFSTTYKINASNGADFVVLVSTQYGTSIWERIVGRSNMNEWPYKITYDNAGNPIVGGVSCVPSGGPSNCELSTSDRAFAIKLNGTNGNFLSARDLASSWGSSDWIRIMSINPTSDGGFVVAGDIYYDSWSGDIDGYVAKFDANMNLQWRRILGTGGNEWLTSAFQTTDGNIVVVGTPFNEIFVAKLNVSNGNLIWQVRYPRTFYNDGFKYFTWAKPSSDGGIIIADEISGGNNKDVLFVKLNSNGGFVCARRIGSPGNDVGIDVVEGANYYYVAGFWNGGDLFYARFNKTNCSLVGSVRYILSSGDESARAIDIRSASGIPYIAGYTNRAGWTAGDYDGLLAADSGIQDTCYWRSLTPTTNVSVTLSASGSWTDYGNTGITVSSATYSSISVNVNKKTACGLLTPVNTEERYEDCYISISKNGRVLYIKSKNRQNLSIKIYASSGKLIYSKDIKDFEGDLNENIKLPSGVYIINVNYGDRKINKRFLVN